MDYQTAHHLIVSQGMATESEPEAMLTRLKHGQPPIPGQVTSILLALKVVYETTRQDMALERAIVEALHTLAIMSRIHYEAGLKCDLEWPPLLDEDISRIGAAVKSIFSGTWQPS